MIRTARIPVITFAILACATTSWAQRPDQRVAQRTEASAASSSLLEQRARLNVENVTLEAALVELTRSSGVPLAFSPGRLPRNVRASCACERIVLRAALDRLLAGTSLQYVEMAGQIVLFPAVDPQLDWNTPHLYRNPGRFARSMIDRMRRSDERTGNGDHAGTAGATMYRLTDTPARMLVGTIVGTVTEAGTGKPIVSAQIAVDGAGRAFTDTDGRYRIVNVQPGSRSVRVTSIGYRSLAKEADVADGETVAVDFALEVSPTSLDKLVVTVTGAQRRREVGHSVASISADSLISNAPVMSLGDLVQGRMPGVLSMQTSNKVGQASSIRLRGLNSLGVSNDPIVIVDGMRVEATSGNGYAFGNSVDVGRVTTSTAAGGLIGRLADFNPNEIASVEIVKGPSATTLYGTDAANGVIVITTKRGQPGRARWSVFSEQGMLEQRLDERQDAYYAFGRSTTTGAPQRCTLVPRAAGACVVDSLASFNTFKHPDTRPFKSGYRQQYGIQVSGGMDQGATYFLSANYEQETGTDYMPSSDQALIRTEQGRELPDWQLRPNVFDKVNVRVNLASPTGSRAHLTLATAFVTNYHRQYANPPQAQVGYRDVNDGWTLGHRPAYRFPHRIHEDVVRRGFGSIASGYSVADWLTLRGTVGADLSTSSWTILARRGEAVPPSRGAGERYLNELYIARYSFDMGATATHAFSPTVTSRTSLGLQYNRRAQRGIQINSSGLPVAGETIAGATNVTSAFMGAPSEGTITTAVAGTYIEEMLALGDRLYLTGALRLDGGSAFGRDLSVAVYPKASVSWVLIDRQRSLQIAGVSSLRLRAAYGASGVQPGPFDALQRIEVGTGLSGTTVVSAAQLGPFGNAGLMPERTSEIEAGLDADLALGRVRLELTAYQRTSHDALINRSLAPSVGGANRWENIGSVRNRGLELLLNAEILRTRDLSAGIKLTGMLNENELIKLADGVVLSSPTSQGSRHDLGYPLYGLWGRKIQSYADANGNGIIEPSEITLTDNEYIGPSFPPREATAAPYVALFGERLRINGLFQYRGGFYVQDFTTANSCRFDLSCRAVNDPATSLAEQAQAVAYSQLTALGVPLYTQPASYLLLRELTAGITLPSRWAATLRASDARILLAARNVAVLWREGTTTAPENGAGSAEMRTSTLSGFAGPPTYWLLRLSLNY